MIKRMRSLRDRSHLCYKSIINDLDMTNILVVSPQVRYIEVFDITNPRFNEQIWPVPSGFVKSRIHCTNSGVGRFPRKCHFQSPTATESLLWQEQAPDHASDHARSFFPLCVWAVISYFVAVYQPIKIEQKQLLDS